MFNFPLIVCAFITLEKLKAKIAVKTKNIFFIVLKNLSPLN
jgi:hypothetical protein